MCHKLDKRFFDELAGLDPAGVCTRSLCSYDRELGLYRIECWDHEYEVSPERCEILPVDKGVPPANTELGLCIIFYLMRSKDVPVSGEWISEKDVPGGVTFFRGPHALPSQVIAEAFDNDLDAFSGRCRDLSGRQIEMGDAGFVFRFLPRIPVAVTYWRGDDEFEPAARVLFDRTVSEHLPIDVIFGMGEEVCFRLARSHSSAQSWY